MVDMNVPQSVARFGLPAMARSDKDSCRRSCSTRSSAAASCPSRLYEEVREKRGLAYGVDTPIVPFKHASVFAGGVATKNEEIGQSLDLIRAEIKRIAADGPTEKELADTKAYLTGSFALRFDTSANIANQMLWIMLEGLGHGYVETRNAQIEAVTIDDVRRAAKRLFDGKDLWSPSSASPRAWARAGSRLQVAMQRSPHGNRCALSCRRDTG